MGAYLELARGCAPHRRRVLTSCPGCDAAVALQFGYEFAAIGIDNPGDPSCFDVVDRLKDAAIQTHWSSNGGRVTYGEDRWTFSAGGWVV